MTQNSALFTVSTAPFWHCGRTIKTTMFHTLLALFPAAAMAVYRYGYDAAEVIAWAGLTAVITEFAIQKLMDRTPTADDYSALVDGVLLAFLLPSTAPVWLVVVGSFLTVALGRMVFGGFGGSPVCAPVVGWCALTISWPDYMDLNSMLLRWNLIEPLSELKYFGLEAVSSVSPVSLLLGENLGALGASQVLMILLGGLYLMGLRRLRWHIPLSFLTGVFAAAFVFNLVAPQTYAPPLFHLFTGSTMLAAFFFMPYPSSSPAWPVSMLLFGFFGGILAVVIRVYGIYPDGVPFAVLLMNLLTPFFDLIQPRPFGGR